MSLFVLLVARYNNNNRVDTKTRRSPASVSIVCDGINNSAGTLSCDVEKKKAKREEKKENLFRKDRRHQKLIPGRLSGLNGALVSATETLGNST